MVFKNFSTNFSSTHFIPKWITPLLLCLWAGTLFGQVDNLQIAEEVLASEFSDVSKADKEGYIITDRYLSKKSNVEHIYLRQSINGIEIQSADFGIHITTQGEVLTQDNHFISEAASKINSDAPTLSAEQAIRALSEEMGYTINQELNLISKEATANQAAVFTGGGISNHDIPVKLVYQPIQDGSLLLAWDMSIDEKNGSDWWSYRVDAETGLLLDKITWTRKCDFGGCSHHNHAEKTIVSDANSTIAAPAVMVPNSYNVLETPVENFFHGARTFAVNPELNNTIASPNGWHQINTTNYLCTQGNNVDAYEDSDDSDSPTGGNSARACGGANLEFDFPWDPNSSSTATYVDAAVTNLFYWNNTIHDVWYNYGFDEAGGNCQEQNFTSNGSGSDGINAEAQDGSGTCNANQSTPPDGSNPRMQMYVCNGRDGDFDNGVIVHEYGHTISIRLTGGPGNSSCLNNSEQMGEGWSDWFGLMMTIEPGDAGTDSRPIGNWLIGQSASGNGIRTFPYSTNMSVNSHTYADISGVSVPHGVGSVWCAMLWEMTWGLIQQHGFDPDLYNGTGGNNIAMALVIEALKLQPCSPGFVDGRDAIIAADQALYGGANTCIIWEAFAKRGLGVNATQGSTGSVSDGTEDFTLPNLCLIYDDYLAVTPDTFVTCNTSSPSVSVDITSSGGFNENVNLAVNGLPSGVSGTFSTNPVTAPGTSQLQLSSLSGVTDGNYTFSVTTSSAGGTPDTVNVQMTITSTAPSAPSTISPAAGATAVSPIKPSFEWSANSNASTYDIEVATDAAFSNIIITEAGIGTTNFTYTGSLNSLTTYYWHCRGTNECGSGAYSATQSFTTDNVVCNIYASTNVPVTISSSGTPTITSTLTIPDGGGILDVNVQNLNISHTYTNDLVIDLAAPSGTEINLINRICGNNNNINLNLDDDSANPYSSIPCPATGGGTYQANGSLGSFATEDLFGIWTMTVDDVANQDGGTLNSWSVEVCYTPGATPLTASATGTDVTCPGNSDGTATATGNGGDLSYTYQWDDPGNSVTATINNLAVGTYTCTVTDGTAATATATFTVGEPAAISSSVSTTNATGNNSDGAVDLTVSGGTPAYTFAWTSNTGGYSANTEDITAVAPDTYYVVITDSNGCISSDTATVGVQLYCTATSTNTSDEWISNVTVGTFVNNSGASNGYMDYTSLTANGVQGDTLAVSLTPTYSGTIYNEWWKIFIDYNEDNDFDDAGEEVFDSGSATNTTVTGSFIVPSATTVGSKRMRVIMRYNSSPSACGTFTYGEVEDYTIDITALPVICVAPNNITITDIEDVKAKIQWDVIPTAIRYRVQYRELGTSTWTNRNRTPSFLALSGLTGGTTYQYRLRTQCPAGWTAYTPVYTFTTDACTTPSNIAVTRITTNLFKLQWDTVPGASLYQIQYQEVGSGTTSRLSTAKVARNVKNLNAGTSYAYQVRSKCSHGLTSYSAWDTVTTNALPIAPRNGDFNVLGTSTMEFYPNPVSDLLNIELNVLATTTLNRLSVYNLLGAEVQSFVLPSNFEGSYQHQMDVRNLNTGTYFIQFKNGDSVITRKFVKLANR